MTAFVCHLVLIVLISKDDLQRIRPSIHLTIRATRDSPPSEGDINEAHDRTLTERAEWPW